MNIIDNIIAVVAPRTAAKRAAARAALDIINSGYGNYGASTSRNSLRGWNWFGGSADEDIHENLDILRQRSRDLYSGAPMATAALKKMRTNVVGQGLRLKSQIDFRYLGLDESAAREIEALIEREFGLFADSPNCDAERIDNFYELQQLAFLNWLLSGDVLALMPLKKRAGTPYELTIRLIEADRISTPTDKTYDPLFESGVERDESGEVVAYWISSNHPLAVDDIRTVNKWTRVSAYGEKTGRRNALFIANRERIGQYRGVPFISPVIEALKQLGRYTDAELMAAVISGMFTVFIEKDGVSEELPMGELEPEDESRPDDRTAAGAIRLGNGSIVDLQDGEKANAINPGRPNANFDGFVKARKIRADLRELDEMITRREEEMCAEALFLGKITVKGEGVDDEIDFGFTNKETLTSGKKWTASGSDPIGDLRRWKRAIAKDGHVNADICIMSEAAAAAFINNEQVQKLLDIKNYSIAKINPMQISAGVSYIGTISALGMSIYTYDEYYTDDWTTPGTEVVKPYVPEGVIGLFSTAAECTMLYGAISDFDSRTQNPATHTGRRYGESFLSENNRVRTLRLSSRPLAVPHNIKSWFVATVV